MTPEQEKAFKKIWEEESGFACEYIDDVKVLAENDVKNLVEVVLSTPQPPVQSVSEEGISRAVGSIFMRYEIHNSRALLMDLIAYIKSLSLPSIEAEEAQEKYNLFYFEIRKHAYANLRDHGTEFDEDALEVDAMRLFLRFLSEGGKG